MNFQGSEWVRRYEDLRRYTLSAVPELAGQALGWAVLVQGGMRCWMQAWQTPAPPPSGEPAPSTSTLPPLQSPPEATVLLTNMVVRALGFSL